ncbi:MAG TPA: co-chaperone GroES [Candidatus Saccharimonadales bacterium]|nr:co-chaperone GroES [Candidatus Saccharimonadales bacterium]
MSTPLQPLGDYLVATQEEAETKTASGLYLPDQAQEKPKTAKVMAVGKNVTDVKVGDRIIYKNDYETTTVKIASQEYIVIYMKNVIATVK